MRYKYVLKAKMNLLKWGSLLVIFLCSASSCNEAELFSKSFDDFPDNRWYKINALEADFSIDKENTIANLDLQLSYVYGSQFSEIPLEVYFTTPNHQIEKIPLVLVTRNTNNKELGDCAGDYCDLTFVIKENYTFSSRGKYKIQVLNAFNYEYLPNLLGVKIKVVEN